MLKNIDDNVRLRVRQLLFLAFFFLFCGGLYAQVSELKKDPAYLWAEGFGSTREEADQDALANLVSRISVNIESQFSNIEKEVVQDGVVTSTTAVESVIKTYSNISSLPFVESVFEGTIINDDGSETYQVCRYILKSEVERIFDGRHKKVLDFYNAAEQGLANGYIDVALNNYYWAYCLLKSLPHANEITNENNEGLMTLIPAKMNEIFGKIKAVKSKKESGGSSIDNVYIKISYDDDPVKSLDFTYFDGKNRTRQLTTARDGDGFMEMYKGASSKDLWIYCEFEYKNEAVRDEEVLAVLNTMKENPFPKSEIRVTGKFMTEKEMKVEDYDISLEEMAYFNRNEVVLTMVQDEDKESYDKVMDAVVKAIKTKNYDGALKYFTDRGQEMFKALVKYGNAKIVTNPNFSYIRFGNQVNCRSLKMCFAFQNNTKKFIENVNFTFNEEGLIEWLAFGLGEEDAEHLLLNPDYSEDVRVLLIQFLENYKTAFALKDLEYIRSIFDDNAVIITGTVIKASNYTSKEKRRFKMSDSDVKYTQYTKQQYLEKLERTFKSNEYVNIRFADHKITTADAKKYGVSYGIQIKQDYFSSRYGDSGYLFLWVDFNTPKEPRILVRTWQPEPDKNFGLYGLGHFK